MPIKSNLEKHTVSWLKRQDADGLLNKNISIQRKEVWDYAKKSNLIVSILLDIPIESLLFEEVDSGHNVLDGKQRTLTLCSFVEDGFTLSEKIRVRDIGGISLVGISFSALPEDIQNRILEYELSISILRPLDSEERATVFFMRNQAVSLTKMDLSRVMLGEEAMNIFSELRTHEFMVSKIKLTEPARRKHEDLQILLQYLLLRHRTETGFSGTEIMNLCDDIKNGEANIQEEEITHVLDYLNSALKEKRQYLKKVHVPTVMYTAWTAMQKNVGAGDFCTRLDKFFEALPNDMEYLAACKSGSAKRTNVLFRAKAMMKIMEDAEQYNSSLEKIGDNLDSEADGVDVSEQRAEEAEPRRNRKKNPA